MEQSPIVQQYGDFVELGKCLVGKNLNLLTVRGFAPLDVLAAISAPDVYDQVENPNGTQRDLKPKHATECFNYAMNSQALVPEDDPRCFPDIMLNARDANVLEIYDLEDEGNLYELSSFSDEDELPNTVVGLRIRATELEYPKPDKAPQISRVDGNHRLWKTGELQGKAWQGGVDEESELEDLDFPKVSFTLLLSLDQLQEAKLFRDINGEHEGMETAHLDTIAYRVAEHSEMKTDPKMRSLWMAHQLANPGRAFENMIFLGGSKSGVKKATGSVPPIKINTLRSTINTLLRNASTVTTNLSDEPELLLELVDRYWKCVRDTFPEAWQDKKDFILLQTIGLGAFAKFGGTVLDRALNDGHFEQAELMNYVAPAASVSLARSEYVGIAGAGGAEFVAQKLIAAATSDEVKRQKAIAALSAATDEGEQTALD